MNFQKSPKPKIVLPKVRTFLTVNLTQQVLVAFWARLHAVFADKSQIRFEWAEFKRRGWTKEGVQLGKRRGSTRPTRQNTSLHENENDHRWLTTFYVYLEKLLFFTTFYVYLEKLLFFKGLPIFFLIYLFSFFNFLLKIHYINWIY